MENLVQSVLTILAISNGIFSLRNRRSAQAQMSHRSRADDDSDQIICERVSLTAPDNL